ncbi:MAG TPA: hypothetical protein VI462_02280 [Acidimicrobiia bacterium]
MPIRAPGRSRRGDALRTAGLTVGAVAGLTAAQVFYQGGVPSYRTIWAEDGQIYFYDAAHKGLASLATPYSGYLQVLTRLVALPATWVPVTSLAVYLAIAGAVCASLAAVSIYWLADQAIPSRALRVALVIAVALHPVLIVENIANITNMIWVLAFAVFWALLRRPVTTGAVVLGAAVAFAGSASTSLTVLYLPIAAYALWSRRERGTQIVVGAYGLGLVLQGITYLTTSEPGASSAAPHLPTLYLARVLGSVAVGDHWAAQLWDSGQRAHLFPFVALVIVLLGVLFAITRGRALIVGTLCLVYSVVTFVVVLVDRGAVGEQLTSRWNDNATRYDVLGVLFVLAAVFVLLSGTGPARRVRVVLSAVVALQLAVVIGFAYRHDNPRSAGPEWTSGLAAATAACEARHLSEVNVPTSPGGVFMVQLPCHDLE